MRNTYKILVGKPEQRPRSILEDDIKTDLKETGRNRTVLDCLRLDSGGGLL
jgi:hypothetical protein